MSMQQKCDKMILRYAFSSLFYLLSPIPSFFSQSFHPLLQFQCIIPFIHFISILVNRAAPLNKQGQKDIFMMLIAFSYLKIIFAIRNSSFKHAYVNDSLNHKSIIDYRVFTFRLYVCFESFFLDSCSFVRNR